MEKKKPKKGGHKFGMKAKILGLSLPITMIMVITLIIIAYTVSRSNMLEESQQLLNTSAKDQSHQIEAWMNRKLDEVKAIKYDIEQSGGFEE